MSGAECGPCSQVVLGRQLQDLLQRADPSYAVPPSLRNDLRTHAQLFSVLQEKNSQLNTLNLKQLAEQRHTQSLSGRLDDQKRLIYAISQSDDAALGRIIQTALRQGAGVDTIIDRIVRAGQGLFSPQKYTTNSFDLVALVLKVSGPRLAFAVAKAMHLPSISTVRKRLHLPQLLPSIGFPTQAEILTNIESFFGHTEPSRRVGHSLQMDEMALEPRIVYNEKSDTAVGFAWEDADKVDLCNLSTRTDPVGALLQAKTLLDSGVCRRATEATMAAIARFDQSDYNPAVILASGTCKAGKAPDQARLIKLIIKCWNESEHGRARHGDIWSICTDGDATRRRALFEFCMTSRLDPESDLFQLLGHLPLLNLCCSTTQMTHDGDYKHEEKRLASAMRSRSGLLVNGAHITSQMLIKYLKCLGDLSDSRIISFFDGNDPQNVPKANALLSNLHRASQLPAITSKIENKPFVLLGEVIGSFIHPYTVPALSLTEQITSLAKCGHLLFALYRTDGTKFIPSQLFYDIQTSIKNAIFCVAKTQLIDLDLPFYLLQTGTDRLESRFGTYRTATSDRNGDLQQMCERAAAAQCIDKIFSDHPSWNRAPYRLSLDGKSGVDHTNPASWIGDVTVGHVDLHACWILGQSQAAEVLKQAGILFDFDPAALSSGSREVDLMRPFGSYPGVQVDTIEPNMEPVPLSELVDGDFTLDAVQSSCFSTASTAGKPVEPQRLAGDELSLEHLLLETPDTSSSETESKGRILVDGKRVYLTSAVRYLLGADGGAKSTDRLRRVCGFTRYLNPSVTKTEPVTGDYFRVLDLAATFVRIQNQVAIAIVRVTNILSHGGCSLESISESQFDSPGISLSGQLLELVFDSGTWYWTQKYDMSLEVSASARRKHTTWLDFRACLSCPLNPDLVEREGERVWAFEHTQLGELMDSLWTRCAKHSPEDNLAACERSGTLPYQIPNTQIVLVHRGATEFMHRSARPVQAECFQCGEQVKIEHEMRVHVGRHLLASRLRHNEANPTSLLDTPFCGFCGRHGTCTTSVERQTRAAKTLRTVSDCPYRSTFTYSTSLRASKSKPCTNRPVECPRCPQGSKYIWSYSLLHHIRAAHGLQAMQSVGEETKKHDPSDEEFEFMRVDKETGVVQPTKGRRRRANADNSEINASGSSSTSKKTRSQR
ncbi:hypothetical protein FRC09_019663 [Ceratobasidium sp. 395]|nr:hypothetical protein FRC09_019663 [Ceratobasidium sp. 395]